MSRQELKNTVIYTFLSFLPATTQLILLPLYMQKLSVAQFGIFQGMTIVQVLVATLFGLSLHASVARYYFSYRHDSIRIKDYLGSIFWFLTLLSAIVFGIGLIAGTFLFDLFYKSDTLDYYPYGIIAVSTGLLNVTVPMFLVVFRIIQHLKAFTLISLTSFLGNLISQVVVLVYLDGSVINLMLGKLWVIAGIYAFLAYYTITRYGFALKKNYLKPSLYFAVPLLPYSLLSWFYIFNDNTIILRFLDEDALGIYNFAVNLAAAVELLVVSVSQAVQPKIFELFTQKKNEQQVKDLHFNYKMIMEISILAIAGLVLIGQNLFLIIPKAEYEKAALYVPLLGIGFLFRVYQIIYTMPLFYQRKTQVFFYLTLGSVVVGFVFHWFLIAYIGLWAAIWAGVLARAIQVPVLYYLAQKHAYFKYSFKDMYAVPLFFMSILGIISYVQVYWNTSLWIGSTLFFVGVFAYFLYSNIHLIRSKIHL
ncbi:MAG: oligosaccharide flippase family protein [Bacteroidia bacterium]|nr:oligosaccharide flippase family protein [Bacteroidia bacterium]MDW8346435.1 oligosaccharide flippase family protein [Bacteroidia bacterium]